MPRLTDREIQEQEAQSDQLLAGLIPTETKPPQRISVAALQKSGQLKEFEHVGGGVLRYRGAQKVARFRISTADGNYTVLDMKRKGVVVSKVDSLEKLDAVLKSVGETMASDNIEIVTAAPKSFTGTYAVEESDEEGYFTLISDELGKSFIRTPVSKNRIIKKLQDLGVEDPFSDSVDWIGEGGVDIKAEESKDLGEAQPGDRIHHSESGKGGTYIGKQRSGGETFFTIQWDGEKEPDMMQGSPMNFNQYIRKSPDQKKPSAPKKKPSKPKPSAPKSKAPAKQKPAPKQKGQPQWEQGPRGGQRRKTPGGGWEYKKAEYDPYNPPSRPSGGSRFIPGERVQVDPYDVEGEIVEEFEDGSVRVKQDTGDIIVVGPDRINVLAAKKTAENDEDQPSNQPLDEAGLPVESDDPELHSTPPGRTRSQEFSKGLDEFRQHKIPGTEEEGQ